MSAQLEGIVGGNDYSSAGFLGVGGPVANNPDADANSALSELESGLRSGRVGEQCQALVRFPKLFEKYPFPILINSASLKLADVFRQSSNFLRLCVLRVLSDHCDRHLDKITNVDEFVKRIFTVLHSNDPVARALTLRTLGAIAPIIPERKQVHHNIRNALDSHDNVELHAAIFAATKFAAKSKTFAVNMCSKISEMIKGYATPLDMKLKLIPIFQHMHHDAQTAQVVRETCLQMLPGYPSEEFVLITLHTLTLLSGHTRVDIPDQVELLLKYLNEDPRVKVKRRVLSDLRSLSTVDRAHLWSESNISSIVSFSQSHQQHQPLVLSGALSVLCDLVRHTSTEKFALVNRSSEIISLCESCCYSSRFEVCARSTMLLTLLAVNCQKEMHHVEEMDIQAEAIMSIEALILLANSGSKVSNLTILKECLQCIVSLCHVHPKSCDQFVDILGQWLNSGDHEENLTTSLPLVCEGLASLGNIKTGVLRLLLPDICNAMTVISTSGAPSSPSRSKVLTLLTTLLLQTMKGHSWTEETREALNAVITHVDLWSCYRTGRNASRYGHHGIARNIFGLIAGRVSSEQLYFWLTGLEQVSQGEEILNLTSEKDFITRISNGNSNILLGVSSINAAATPHKNQEFQIQYLKCRSAMLCCLSQLVSSCNSLRTSPPPAIAATQAKQAHDELQRCGRITYVIRQSVKGFQEVGLMYSDLYQSSFDADPDTLVHLQILQQLNSSIGQWIEMTCLKSNLSGSMYLDQEIEFGMNLRKPKEEFGIEIQALLALSDSVARQFASLSRDPNAQNPISHVHTDCLMKVVAQIASHQLCMPRFFFQAMQTTGLKLAVTPQPRSISEPVPVNTSQQLAVKVEGVITSTSQLSQPWRKVSSILISLQSTLINPSKAVASSLETRKPGEMNQQLSQTSIPHNDFFTGQFLVPFPVAGSHQVVIDTQFEDSDGRLWKTGRKTTLTVKAYDDGQNRPSAAAAAQPAPPPSAARPSRP